MVEESLAWLDATHLDKNGKVTVNRGPRHPHLGMALDCTLPGRVIIDMSKCVTEMVEEFGVTCSGSTIPCPWTDKSFDVDDKSPVLSEAKAETFHTFVAKSLFVSTRGRPDIQPAVAFLCARVQKPTQQDWNKLTKLMKFLKSTKMDVLLSLIHI